MEMTSDSSPSPKRRRFSGDYPSSNSTDTDESFHEVPRQKKKQERSQSTNELAMDDDPDDEDDFDDNSTRSNPTNTSFDESNEITFNGAFDDFNVHAKERDKLTADFKRVTTRFQRGGSEIEGIEEIRKTLEDLAPMKDVVYLYIRFARQPPSNFNTDSLCSLLCISKQCNIKPYVFLTQVKSMEIQRNVPKFGISFLFRTRDTKDFDAALIEQKLIGLKYTLKMLQSTITKSEAILGKATLGGKKGRLAQTNTSHATFPESKCSSLFSKFCSGIDHRWLAYQVIDHLFSRNKAASWTNQEIFVFSIKAFTSCGRSRYDFLNPLVGLCLRFNDHADIDANQGELAPIQSNPTLFNTFGNTCLRGKTSALQIQGIYDTFSGLRKSIQRKTSYRSLSLDLKWLLLKAYTFHLWLHQAQNNAIKRSVLKMLSQEKKPASSKITGDTSGNLCRDMRKRPPPTNSDATPLPSTPPLDSTPPVNPNGGLQKLLESRKKAPKSWQPNDCGRVNNIPGEDPVNDVLQTTSHFDDMTTDPKINWNNFRILSTQELNEFLASFLIIRREDQVDIVSRLSSFEVYSADNLHRLHHCRLNGKSDFYPSTSVGDVVLNIGNKIVEFMDIASRTYHIAREGSIPFREHGQLIPAIKEIASLCQAVIRHGTCDSKRCSGQRRAFIGNGGLDFPNGIPRIIVDGGFRKKLTDDPSFCLDKILKTVGGLSEFLWRTMADMQHRANDLPMAPDRFRHAAYSNHLCTLLSMADCVSFENITLVVSTIYPFTSDLSEHKDVMNDSITGYTRTGTLNMCFMIDDKNQEHQLGLQLQVIGNFRRVIRQYMEWAFGSHQEQDEPIISTPAEDGSTSTPNARIRYEANDIELLDAAYNFGVCLRNEKSARPIIFDGRKSSRTSDGAQSYSNNYNPSKITYIPYCFKVANFCDKEYTSQQNIRQLKVLGHMERPRHVSTQMNAFNDFENGMMLLDYLQKKYGDKQNLGDMRSATYHQQIMNDTQAEWTIFEGHVDKNFVHTAWFVPLTHGTFYTFIAVPNSWNVPPHQDSETKYEEWMSTIAEKDRKVLRCFRETFQQQAKEFMKTSNIGILVYHCSVGSFLSFPANLCYHATVSIQRQTPSCCQMKDLLIVYPTESG